jgi:hypothetical protein
LRSVRRESTDPAESLLAVHKVLLEISDGAATSTATIGHWNAPASTFRWVTTGDDPPLRITASGQLTPLEGETNYAQKTPINSTTTPPSSCSPPAA